MPGTYAILVVSIFPSREFVYYMLLFVCFSGKKKKKTAILLVLMLTCCKIPNEPFS